MLQMRPLLGNVLLKHVSRATDMHTTVGELLEAVLVFGPQQTDVS
jgi:hypothetical protein